MLRIYAGVGLLAVLVIGVFLVSRMPRLADDNGSSNLALESALDEESSGETSVDQLLDTLVVLRESWKTKSHQEGLVENQERARLASQLMELDTGDIHHVYALNEYIEAVTILDWIVSLEKMEMPEVRVAVEEVVEKYRQHESLPVRSSACLAYVAVPLHDHLRSGAEGAIDEFVRRLDQCADRVLEDRTSTSRIGKIIFSIRSSRNWDGTAVPFCVALARKMQESNRPEIQKQGEFFQERFYFGHLELEDLVSRVRPDDAEGMAVVVGFFRGLESYPNVRLPIYQVAIAAIEKTKMLELREDYEKLLQWLVKIVEKIDSESKKSTLLVGIEKLKALPWGPVDVPAKSGVQ